MVLKTNTCRFSGLRIYPGKGLVFIRTDGQQYMFLNKKCKSYYHNRLRPAKLAWTVTYRKQHKKDQVRMPCRIWRGGEGVGRGQGFPAVEAHTVHALAATTEALVAHVHDLCQCRGR